MNIATTIQRADQFRYYPTTAQWIALNQYCGAARSVWNACLAWRFHSYKVNNEKITGVDYCRELTFLKTLASLAWWQQTPVPVAVRTKPARQPNCQGLLHSNRYAVIY